MRLILVLIILQFVFCCGFEQTIVPHTFTLDQNKDLSAAFKEARILDSMPGSLLACISICNQNADCMAMRYSNSISVCYFFNQTFCLKNDTVNAIGVDLYMKRLQNDNCNNCDTCNRYEYKLKYKIETPSLPVTTTTTSKAASVTSTTKTTKTTTTSSTTKKSVTSTKISTTTTATRTRTSTTSSTNSFWSNITKSFLVCPQSWIFITNHCFKISSRSYTQKDGSNICQNEWNPYSNLLTIRSQSQFDFWKTRTSAMNTFFIGGICRPNQTTYSFYDDTKLSVYSRWFNPSQQVSPTTNCQQSDGGCISLSGSHLYHEDCRSSYQYICEIGN